MPQVTQGQGTTPYEGKTIFSARIAGRETPTGTGLTPEAEHMFRMAYTKELAAITRLKMDLAIQSITSYANVAVTAQNATTNALNAVANMARTGQLNNEMTLKYLTNIAEMSGSIKMSAGINYEKESHSKIIAASRDLENRNLSAGTKSIASSMATLKTSNATPKMVATCWSERNL